jgi:hypothetical protein
MISMPLKKMGQGFDILVYGETVPLGPMFERW